MHVGIIRAAGQGHGLGPSVGLLEFKKHFLDFAIDFFLMAV
jgi:hypothetical protein